MPALPAAANVIRVDLHQSVAGVPNVLNHFFLKYTGTMVATDLNSWAASVGTAWGVSGSVAVQQCTNVELYRIVMTDLTSASAPQADITVAVPGTSGGTVTPASTCLVVKQHFQRRYRGGHSRVYLTGYPQASLGSPPNWSSGTPANVASNWQHFISQVITNAPGGYTPITHVNVSYFAGFTNKTFPSGRVRPVPTPRGTPVTDLILSYSGNTKVASQRRRNLQSA